MLAVVYPPSCFLISVVYYTTTITHSLVRSMNYNLPRVIFRHLLAPTLESKVPLRLIPLDCLNLN